MRAQQAEDDTDGAFERDRESHKTHAKRERECVCVCVCVRVCACVGISLTLAAWVDNTPIDALRALLNLGWNLLLPASGIFK